MLKSESYSNVRECNYCELDLGVYVCDGVG